VGVAARRDADQADEVAVELALVAVAHRRRNLGRGHAAAQELARAVDARVGEELVGRYADLGAEGALSKELGPSGILANVVMPGLTLTETNRDRIPAALRDELAAKTPIRRLLSPEEVVPTIVFLGSAANTAVTGEVIRASGGAT
jgi:3-oxoacyl-[acyl-carrier protein] reductase